MNTDAAFNLFAAILRQWIKDARRDAHERYLLTRFLGCNPAEIDRIVAGHARPAHRTRKLA